LVTTTWLSGDQRPYHAGNWSLVVVGGLERKYEVVMVNKQSRPAPLRVFGGEVRRYRELRGWSQAQLAGKVPISSTHIGNIERGDGKCDRKLAVRLDEILGTQGAVPALWDQLVQSATFPVWFDWPQVEAQAVALEIYEYAVVTGLLQTPAYASVVLGGDEGAVAARMGRQEILCRESPAPPRLSVIFSKCVLTNEIGGPDVMREQLEHLLSLPSPKISIQVLEGSLTPAGTSGAFCLATLPDRSELAYLETAAKGLTLNESDDLNFLSDAYASVRSRALPVDQSRDYIRKIMEEEWT
jgi:transcriptional regulator with XRE-family HTH domain